MMKMIVMMLMSMVRNKQIKKISTGSKNLDNLFLGGIETHAITEFYGPGDAGKSQICFTLSVISAQTSTVIYVDTEAKFRPERLAMIAQARGIDNSNTNWLSKILYVNTLTTYQQEEILKNSVLQLLENKRSNVSLLIVDSVINNYRAEFLGPTNLSERQQRLYQLMNLLSHIAQNYGIAIVITNQVNSSHPYSSTGGHVIAYSSNYRICLRRRYAGDKVTATLVKSPYHLGNNTDLMLSEKGIEDM
jgi:DNA repair protein RadA